MTLSNHNSKKAFNYKKRMEFSFEIYTQMKKTVNTENISGMFIVF